MKLQPLIVVVIYTLAIVRTNKRPVSSQPIDFRQLQSIRYSTIAPSISAISSNQEANQSAAISFEGHPLRVSNYSADIDSNNNNNNNTKWARMLETNWQKLTFDIRSLVGDIKLMILEANNQIIETPSRCVRSTLVKVPPLQVEPLSEPKKPEATVDWQAKEPLDSHYLAEIEVDDKLWSPRSLHKPSNRVRRASRNEQLPNSCSRKVWPLLGRQVYKFSWTPVVRVDNNSSETTLFISEQTIAYNKPPPELIVVLNTSSRVVQ